MMKGYKSVLIQIVIQSLYCIIWVSFGERIGRYVCDYGTEVCQLELYKIQTGIFLH